MKKYTQYYAGSLTNIKQEDREKFLKTANKEMKAKKFEKLHISVEPQMVTKEFLLLLKQYNVITVELEVKIANNYILKKYKLNFEIEDIKKASKLIKRNRMNLGYQLIVGFPDSTKIDEEESAKLLMKSRPKFVSICPMLVIEGTELEEIYKNNEYDPLTLPQAIDRCKDLIYMFNKKRIKAITIYMQNLDSMLPETIGASTISEQKDKIRVIAGPVHKEFTQLVEDSIWYDSIVGRIKKYNNKIKEVKVEVHPTNVNNVIGYEKENIRKFKELYSVEIQVTPNEKIKPGRSEMKILTVYED